jgi:hypothetical protein
MVRGGAELQAKGVIDFAGAIEQCSELTGRHNPGRDGESAQEEDVITSENPHLVGETALSPVFIGCWPVFLSITSTAAYH